MATRADEAGQTGGDAPEVGRNTSMLAPRSWIETIVAAAAGSTPIVALLSPNALVLLSAAAALGILIAGPRDKILRSGPRRMAVALGLLTILGLASAIWSIAPSRSIYKVMQVLPLFAVAYVLVGAAFCLSSSSRERIGRWLTAGVVAAVLLLVADAAAGGMLNHLLAGGQLYADDALIRYKRGAAILALLAGPAAYWVWRRLGKAAAAAVLGGAALSAIIVESGTTVVAIAVGVLWATITVRHLSFGRRSLAAGLAILFLAAPLARFGPSELPPDVIRQVQVGELRRVSSALHRLLIWQFVGEKIAERPIIGWGLDSSRAVPGGQDRPANFPERLPLHPHNAALQVWLELGVLGAIVGTFLIAWPAARIEVEIEPGLAQVAAVGVLATGTTVALSGFGIWQSWWLGAIALAAMCAVAVLPPRAKIA